MLESKVFLNIKRKVNVMIKMPKKGIGVYQIKMKKGNQWCWYSLIKNL